MRALWAAVIVFGLAGTVAFHISRTRATSDPPPHEASESRERLERWAHVGRESRLANGETLREIRIPDDLAPGIPSADRVCFLFTNEVTGDSDLECPAEVFTTR